MKAQESKGPNPTGKEGATIKALRQMLSISAGSGKYWLIAGLSLLAVVLYVGLTAVTRGPGLPLDDGWIHQTYARNLVQNGRWAYASGVISAGSTAPLWTVALAFGYLIGVSHLLWAYLLGWLSLTWIGWASMGLWSTLWPRRENIAWLAGSVMVLTWPLIWAAGSGMETLLFIALVLQLMVLYCRQMLSGEWRPWLLGVLAGLLILTRPDGLALFALIIFGLLTAAGTPKARIIRSIVYLLAAAAPLIPYFALNLWSSGTIWPNTFYAKQAEYAFLWEKPFILRYVQLLYFALGGPAEGWRGISGAHFLLLPGLVSAAWVSIQGDWMHRRLLLLLPLTWAAGHIFLYAWRLPVTYQHGRYLIPAIPIFILYGLAGWLRLAEVVRQRVRLGERMNFIGRTFGSATFAAFLSIFLFLGLQVYMQDVAFIDGEMVATARWLETNTPAGALIAAHDIGAIGYFANRDILDLAGLISPEVVPFIDDQEGLAAYVRQSEADYLVTAPGWPYTNLTESGDAKLVFSSRYAWTQAQGINNMKVYELGG